jgi:hypothetical protein
VDRRVLVDLEVGLKRRRDRFVGWTNANAVAAKEVDDLHQSTLSRVYQGLAGIITGGAGNGRTLTASERGLEESTRTEEASRRRSIETILPLLEAPLSMSSISMVKSSVSEADYERMLLECKPETAATTSTGSLNRHRHRRHVVQDGPSSQSFIHSRPFSDTTESSTTTLSGRESRSETVTLELTINDSPATLPAKATANLKNPSPVPSPTTHSLNDLSIPIHMSHFDNRSAPNVNTSQTFLQHPIILQTSVKPSLHISSRPYGLNDPHRPKLSPLSLPPQYPHLLNPNSKVIPIETHILPFHTPPTSANAVDDGIEDLVNGRRESGPGFLTAVFNILGNNRNALGVSPVGEGVLDSEDLSV